MSAEEVKTPETMGTWNELNKAIPSEFLTRFTKGRFNGTEIKPMARIQRLTELFGACGKGWGVNFKERWVDQWPGCNFACCYVRLSIWYKEGDEIFEAPDQIGGSLVDNDPDECWKSAYTDALGKCASMLGLGAYIYLGQADGKYAKQKDGVEKQKTAAQMKTEVEKPSQLEFSPQEDQTVPF